MIKSFIILFREGFEAFLILFIVLGVIKKTNQISLFKPVIVAALTAVSMSVFLALGFRILHVDFEGKTEQLFEGFTMVTTSFLLAVMILWLIRFKTNTNLIKDEVSKHIQTNSSLGIFLLVFFSVFREGVETTLFFLIPDEHGTVESYFIGGVLGLISAFVLCYLIFRGSFKINFKLFFLISTIFLIIIAAGLFARGVHELQEAKWLPELGQAWNLNPKVNEDGSFPALHEKGSIGAFLKSLIGYNGNPDYLEIISYSLYLFVIGMFWWRFERRNS